MARLNKSGLSYFPLDVDIFEDKKMQLILAEFGTKGESITMRLLCLVYKNGYYYKFSEEDSLLIANRVGNGVTGSLVMEVVKALVKRSLFNEGVFNKFQVLTSKGIQERYFEAVNRRKIINVYKEYLIADISLINVNINSLNDDINSQSKGKESKGNESNRGETPPIPREELLAKKQSDFYESLKPFISEYGKDMLREFYNHWAEPNKSRTKIKWEMEDTWDTKLRLEKWRRNDDKWSRNKTDKPTGEISDAAQQLLNKINNGR